MFNTIMVPVDLRHEEKLVKTLNTAEKLAKAHGSKVVFVGVSVSAPSEIARNPKEFSTKLARFAEEQSRLHSIQTESHPIFSVDPTADLDDKLLECIDELKADLVIMATHLPGVSDYIFGNNGNYIASHAEISVFLVRS